MNSEGKALIGNHIVGFCVNHEDKSNTDKIIDRRYKITLNYRSGRRKGKLSRAFINSTVMLKTNQNESYWVVNNKEEMEKIKTNLKEKFKCDFRLVLTGNEIVYAQKLFGECSDYKATLDPTHSAIHRGQRVDMKCNIFALCYQEVKDAQYKIIN